jgi:hypothetical protein
MAERRAKFDYVYTPATLFSIEASAPCLSDDPSGAAFKIGQLHSAVHQAFRMACQAMHVQAEEDRADADFIFDKVIEAVKGGAIPIAFAVESCLN